MNNLNTNTNTNINRNINININRNRNINTNRQKYINTPFYDDNDIQKNMFVFFNNIISSTDTLSTDFPLIIKIPNIIEDYTDMIDDIIKHKYSDYKFRKSKKFFLKRIGQNVYVQHMAPIKNLMNRLMDKITANSTNNSFNFIKIPSTLYEYIDIIDDTIKNKYSDFNFRVKNGVYYKRFEYNIYIIQNKHFKNDLEEIMNYVHRTGVQSKIMCPSNINIYNVVNRYNTIEFRKEKGLQVISNNNWIIIQPNSNFEEDLNSVIDNVAISRVDDWISIPFEYEYEVPLNIRVKCNAININLIRKYNPQYGSFYDIMYDYPNLEIIPIFSNRPDVMKKNYINQCVFELKAHGYTDLAKRIEKFNPNKDESSPIINKKNNAYDMMYNYNLVRAIRLLLDGLDITDSYIEGPSHNGFVNINIGNIGFDSNIFPRPNTDVFNIAHTHISLTARHPYLHGLQPEFDYSHVSEINNLLSDPTIDKRIYFTEIGSGGILVININYGFGRNLYNLINMMFGEDPNRVQLHISF